ncbi:hypothetical protein INT45_009474 [Circinella minor]|uniref:Uncharacterized protein n=1 Tax=Circinella minor TaxID=1195481 RepID=A0A8H7RRK5_9FUNG|nr:hypothetical protein INT45_009474 [Circinella minor]
MHLRERATEELAMLKKDAINVTRFFSEQITALRFAINNIHGYNNEFEEQGVVSDGEADDMAVDVKVFEKYYTDANSVDKEQQFPVAVDHINIDTETSEVDLNTTTDDDDDDDDIASIISLLAHPEQLTENEDME